MRVTHPDLDSLDQHLTEIIEAVEHLSELPPPKSNLITDQMDIIQAKKLLSEAKTVAAKEIKSIGEAMQAGAAPDGALDEIAGFVKSYDEALEGKNNLPDVADVILIAVDRNVPGGLNAVKAKIQEADSPSVNQQEQPSNPEANPENVDKDPTDAPSPQEIIEGKFNHIVDIVKQMNQEGADVITLMQEHRDAQNAAMDGAIQMLQNGDISLEELNQIKQNAQSELESIDTSGKTGINYGSTQNNPAFARDYSGFAPEKGQNNRSGSIDKDDGTGSSLGALLEANGLDKSSLQSLADNAGKNGGSQLGQQNFQELVTTSKGKTDFGRV